MQIAALLKEKIKNHEIKPGERLQSVRKLASELSVGRQVIVSAFDILAKENILKKRHGCGIFVNPDLNEKKKSLRIGVWINAVDISSASNSGILFNICRKAAEHGHNIILGTSIDNKNFTEWTRTNNIDGLIISGLINDRFVKTVEKEALPFVVLGNYELKNEFNRVELDISAIETVISNEVDKYSCRNVGLIAGKSTYLISREIEAHVRNALAEKRLPVNKELLRFSDNEDGYTEIKYLLEKASVRPDLLYATEQSFLGIARYYFEKNLSRKNAPRLIVSCMQKEKIPYPELVDITIECGVKGTEKAFEILIEMINGPHKDKPVLHKTYAKILYGSEY